MRKRQEVEEATAEPGTNPSTWPEIGTQDDWAPILRKKPSWFEMARHKGGGPTYTLVGRKPMYLREDILAYLRANKRTWTRGEAAGEAAAA